MYTQLTRSRTNKLIGGVAGGIAETYGLDPTLVRIAFILLGMAHGIGLLLYIVLLLIIPKAGTAGAVQPAGSADVPRMNEMQAFGQNRMVGAALLGLGTLMVASMLHLSGPIIAVMLIGTGWYLLRRR